MKTLILTVVVGINVHLNWDAPAMAAKPLVVMYSPSDWQCTWCDRAKQYDWSEYPFRVEFVDKDSRESQFTRWPVFHMGGSKPAYYYGFDPQGLLKEWKKRNE